MTRTTPRPTGTAARGTAVHPWADVVLPEPEHDAGVMDAAGQLWATLTDLGRSPPSCSATPATCCPRRRWPR